MFSAGDRVMIVKTGRLMAYNHRKSNWKKLNKLKFAAGREGVCVEEGRFILPYGLEKYGVILSEAEASEFLVAI